MSSLKEAGHSAAGGDERRGRIVAGQEFARSVHAEAGRHRIRLGPEVVRGPLDPRGSICDPAQEARGVPKNRGWTAVGACPGTSPVLAPRNGTREELRTAVPFDLPEPSKGVLDGYMSARLLGFQEEQYAVALGQRQRPHDGHRRAPL